MTVALKPLHDAAGLRSFALRRTSPSRARASRRWRGCARRASRSTTRASDWTFDGEEFEEETKIQEETRKILELPDLPVQAMCVRVPVLVGHLEAVWIETETRSRRSDARALLGSARAGVVDIPSPAQAAGIDDVLVGRIRRDPAAANGLTPMVAGDNLRKGAALNAEQIAELLLASVARSPA